MEKIDKIKTHIKEHKKVYISGVTVIVIAGITFVIMRRGGKAHINGHTSDQVLDKDIQGGISVLAPGGISVRGKNNVLNLVSYFDNSRKGPPSWVIRCLENDRVFTSQNNAAIEMGLPASEISKHLNGLMDNVRGYHFERICMAA
jgi:hypothetical protein